MMDRQFEQKIRERAYQIWIEAGRMHGLELEHWTKAERDVAMTKPTALKPAAGASATKPATVKVAKTTAKAVAPKTVATKAAATKAVTTKAVTTKAVTTKPTAKASSVKTSPDAAKSPRRTKAPAAEVRGTLN